MRRFTFAVLALIVVALNGCGSGNTNNSNSSNSDVSVFRYPIITSPTSLDPGVVQDGDTLDIIQQIYEGLVTWSPENEPVPALAESWTISDDGMTYTFIIRQGVKFHSGNVVTADDVKWSIERNANSGLESETIAAYLSDIVGLEDMVDGKANEVEGIKVIDDHTLTITLIKPTPYFLGKLTYLVSAVLDRKFAPPNAEMSQVSQMVGCGPFRIIQHERNQIVILEAFEDYHGGKPLIDRIERPVVIDAMTRLNMYKNGELDLVMLQRQDIEGLKQTEYNEDLKLFARPAIWYIGLNQDMFEPFEDIRVRQAFAKAIDKERIVKEVLGNHNLIANSILPPGVPGHRDDAPAHEFDPAEARKLLSDAGYPNGRDFPTLTMTFREQFPDIKLAAEAVVGDLKKYLNIDINLQTMEWRNYLDKYNKHEQVFFHMRWAADYLDPQNFLSHMLATTGPENKIGYSNQTFDFLCGQADTMMDMSERIPLYQQAEDALLNDAVWIPIYFQRDAELHRPVLTGLRESLFGHLPHTTVQIKD